MYPHSCPRCLRSVHEGEGAGREGVPASTVDGRRIRTQVGCFSRRPLAQQQLAALNRPATLRSILASKLRGSALSTATRTDLKSVPTPCTEKEPEDILGLPEAPVFRVLVDREAGGLA